MPTGHYSTQPGPSWSGLRGRRNNRPPTTPATPAATPLVGRNVSPTRSPPSADLKQRAKQLWEEANTSQNMSSPFVMYDRVPVGSSAAATTDLEKVQRRRERIRRLCEEGILWLHRNEDDLIVGYSLSPTAHPAPAPAPSTSPCVSPIAVHGPSDSFLSDHDPLVLHLRRPPPRAGQQEGEGEVVVDMDLALPGSTASSSLVLPADRVPREELASPAPPPPPPPAPQPPTGSTRFGQSEKESSIMQPVVLPSSSREVVPQNVASLGPSSFALPSNPPSAFGLSTCASPVQPSTTNLEEYRSVIALPSTASSAQSAPSRPVSMGHHPTPATQLQSPVTKPSSVASSTATSAAKQPIAHSPKPSASSSSSSHSLGVQQPATKLSSITDSPASKLADNSALSFCSAGVSPIKTKLQHDSDFGGDESPLLGLSGVDEVHDVSSSVPEGTVDNNDNTSQVGSIEVTSIPAPAPVPVPASARSESQSIPSNAPSKVHYSSHSNTDPKEASIHSKHSNSAASCDAPDFHPLDNSLQQQLEAERTALRDVMNRSLQLEQQLQLQQRINAEERSALESRLAQESALRKQERTKQESFLGALERQQQLLKQEVEQAKNERQRDQQWFQYNQLQELMAEQQRQLFEVVRQLQERQHTRQNTSIDEHPPVAWAERIQAQLAQQQQQLRQQLAMLQELQKRQNTDGTANERLQRQVEEQLVFLSGLQGHAAARVSPRRPHKCRQPVCSCHVGQRAAPVVGVELPTRVCCYCVVFAKCLLSQVTTPRTLPKPRPKPDPKATPVREREKRSLSRISSVPRRVHAERVAVAAAAQEGLPTYQPGTTYQALYQQRKQRERERDTDTPASGYLLRSPLPTPGAPQMVRPSLSPPRNPQARGITGSLSPPPSTTAISVSPHRVSLADPSIPRYAF